MFRKSPIESENSFLINIEKMGGKVIGKYKNIFTKVKCECFNGHICFPLPNAIQQGQGMCRKCTGNCPEEAEKIFISNVENLGGKIVGLYKGARIPIETICSNGHTCFSTPGQTRRGGMCNKCVNHCPEDAEKNFIKNIEKLGGKIIGKYINRNTRIECVCPNNHTCYPNPSKIQSGREMCKKCTLEQTESKGEKITALALDKLNISYIKQYIHPKLPRLKFDFQFYHQNIMFFIEFDGIQHHKYQKYFHRQLESFDKQRQRDLMKNYLIKNTENYVLIRLDHEWTRMIDAVNILSNYLEECINNPIHKIYATNEIYGWIYDEPREESIKKYFIDA